MTRTEKYEFIDGEKARRPPGGRGGFVHEP